jgi:hypothetical protein
VTEVSEVTLTEEEAAGLVEAANAVKAKVADLEEIDY